LSLSNLRKVIFPAAGLGTRFLPATKATPKEMLTIVDKPLIQYGVEEALASGMDEIIIITGRGKRTIEDHFDVSAELERSLRDSGKDALYQKVSYVSRMADVAYVRQKYPRGLGHAVACAAPWIHHEPFGVVLADELILSSVPVMQQLRMVYEKTGCSVVALSAVPPEQVHQYGIVAYQKEGDLMRLTDMVEKPNLEDAPSNMAIIGRYIFTPRIMALLQQVQPGSGGEIQLTDAIAELAKSEGVYGVVVDGQRFDAGNPLGFLKANAAIGRQHKEYGEAFSDFLSDL